MSGAVHTVQPVAPVNAAVIAPDHDQLDKFVRAIFCYADPDTFISLRGFDQFRRDVPPEIIRPVKVNGDLSVVVQAAYAAADECANAGHPVVFAPPVCTFNNQDRARGIDLANGVALSVEIDEGDTAAARSRLEGLLGPCTVVMASGGVWDDPETGEVHTKLHLHWRLNEPTRDASDHARLRMARDIAAQLSGGDPTGKPVVHPLRWPGSWNQKDTRSPRLAKIIAMNDAAEIDLSDAIDALTDAQEAAGMAVAAIPQSSDPTAPVPLVAAAMAFIPNAGTDVHYDDWIKMGYAVYRATGGGDDGYKIWDEWSAKSSKYEPNEQSAAWGRIHRAVVAADVPVKVGAGTIFFHAKMAGWVRPEPEQPEPPADHPDDPGPTDPSAGDSYEPETTRLFVPINPVHLRYEPIPARQWVVEDWLPIGTVTANYGDGGTGKTLLSQQLMTSTATGAPWCGREVMRCRSLGLFCEDDEAELHRRQDAINRALGVDFGGLGDMRWISGVGQDCTLADFDFNHMTLTKAFAEVVELAQDTDVRLLVLDTAADLFGGEENVRRQVRQFIGALTKVAITINGAVLLNAHPSRSGIASGKLDGGSTAWNNSVRSRWSLARVSADDGGDQDPDARVLTRQKANYSRIGEEIRLHWVRGALVPFGSATSAGSSIERAACEIVFLDLLDRRYRQGVWVSHSKNAGNYAPKVFAMSSDRKGYGRKDFEGAMNRLLDERRICNEEYGRGGNPRQRLAVQKPPPELGGAT